MELRKHSHRHMKYVFFIQIEVLVNDLQSLLQNHLKNIELLFIRNDISTNKSKSLGLFNGLTSLFPYILLPIKSTFTGTVYGG